jgi:hypothetical protein
MAKAPATMQTVKYTLATTWMTKNMAMATYNIQTVASTLASLWMAKYMAKAQNTM